MHFFLLLQQNVDTCIKHINSHFYELKHNTKLQILMLLTNVKIIRKQKIENFDKKAISFQVITFRRYHFPPMHLNIF